MTAKKIAIGSDHAGFGLKAFLKRTLQELGVEPVDFGPDSDESIDYPDYAHAVSAAVSAGQYELGLLACGSGIGMSMTANRHPGVRAALVWNEDLADLARRHNDANVLVLPARFINEEEAANVVKKFLDSQFEGGRHKRRVNKIELERDD